MSESTPKSNLGERLRSARGLAGLSQGQVAKLLNLHRPTISEMEAGRRKVSSDELAKLAQLYGVSISWLADAKESESEMDDPRVVLAARELAKLKSEDLDRVLHLLTVLRSSENE